MENGQGKKRRRFQNGQGINKEFEDPRVWPTYKEMMI